MRTYTGSTNCDDRATSGGSKGKIMVNLLENIRDPEEIERLNLQYIQNGKSPKYNLENARRNIVYESCKTTEEVFKYVFGDAMKAFNSRQKRSDRKTNIEKEMEKLSKGKVKQELIHCMIVQIGNSEERPPEDECVEMLQEYYAEFKERFPNMRVVSAAIHLDEDTPHLQLYFVPVKTKEQHEANGSRKKWSGMDVQPSLTGALEQMGYTNDATVMVPKKDENGEPLLNENGEPVMKEVHDYRRGAMAQWQKDFNGLLDEICLNHDIVIDHYMRGRKVSHQDTRDYYSGKVNQHILQALRAKEKAEGELTRALFDAETAQEEAEQVGRQLEASQATLSALEVQISEKRQETERVAIEAKKRLNEAYVAFIEPCLLKLSDCRRGLKRMPDAKAARAAEMIDSAIATVQRRVPVWGQDALHGGSKLAEQEYKQVKAWAERIQAAERGSADLEDVDELEL